MEWIKIKKYKSDGEVICRINDIDYLSSATNDVTTLHLKNGEYFHVESDGLFALLRHLEKVEKNTLYGMSVAHPLPDYDPEILRSEIQDLKLENDRLQKREDIMFDFICSISCVRKVCSECKLNRPDKFDELGAKCAYLQGGSGREYIREEASNILKKLEEL